MNVILVDSDCRKYFPQEDAIKNLLNDSRCQIRYLEPLQKPELEPGCRCVLLTAMNGGLKKYHRDLMITNPQVRTWILSIVGVSLESEQSQLADHISSALSDSKAAYKILFEDADLKKTAAACAVPVKEKRMCLIVSANSEASRQCAEVMSSYLRGWDVVHRGAYGEELYQEADVIVAAGEKREDFFLPAPKYNMGRLYAWVRGSDEEGSQLRSIVYDTLTERNWNLGSVKKVYSSVLELEEYSRKLGSGEISPWELIHDENFVIWDEYGLPLSSSSYSADAIDEFLGRQCCFNRLTENF